jgi:CBS domain-containing protein
MSRHTPTVPPDMTLSDAVDRVILPGGVSEIPVVEDGRFLGVLRLKSIRSRESSSWSSLTARDLLVPGEPVEIVAPDDDAVKVLTLLGIEDRLLPVVGEGEFLGVVSRGELLRRLQIRMELSER